MSIDRWCVVGHPRRGRRLLIGFLVLAAWAMAGCDWTQAGFNGGASYYNRYESGLTASTVGSLHEVFSSALPANRSGDPIVVRGKVIVASRDGSVASVSAFAAGTGTPAWTATIPGDAARITAPVSDGSRVFVGADVDSSSTVLALDVADGSVVWTAGPDDPASVASLVVTNGRLVAGFDSWRDPMAVDPSTGATIWSQHDQHFAAGSPLVTGDGRIVKQWTVPFDTNHPPILHFDLPHGEIIDSADGSLGFTWGSDVPEPAPSFYIAYGDSLIGTDGSGNTIAANGDDPYGDGWSAPVCCARATNGDVVLVGYGPPGWTALDLQDGATRYEIPAPAGMTGSSQPTFAASLLYVVTTDANGSTLRTFDAATGVAVSSLPVPITAASSRTSVIVANGRVYLTAGDSLHAYATA